MRPGIECLEGRVLLDAVRWVNPAGGAWGVAANWDAGRVPGPDDDAVIDLRGVTVTHPPGSDAVHSLQLTGSTLDLSGGTLAVATAVQGDGTLTLSGGTLARATVAAGLTFRGTAGALDGVTVNTSLTIVGPTPVRVADGLTINGTLYLGTGVAKCTACWSS